jgi:hypothetical protein
LSSRRRESHVVDISHLLELVLHGASHHDMRVTATACKSDQRSNISTAEAQNTPATRCARQLPPWGAGRRGLLRTEGFISPGDIDASKKADPIPENCRVDRTNLFTVWCGGAHGWTWTRTEVAWLLGRPWPVLPKSGQSTSSPHTGPTMASRARGGGGKRRRWGGTFY